MTTPAAGRSVLSASKIGAVEKLLYAHRNWGLWRNDGFQLGALATAEEGINRMFKTL